ncbi:hypothetical protein L9F63_017029 [Diploptera punctata]|uniref:Uncharacterized protein n=1 Tax=Diploptera punctata TaxID=6984 RepID=A0AAD8EH90_DIPPU|nr:hypothetical protein L9F63_017029 [Diploptera punctata]
MAFKNAEFLNVIEKLSDWTVEEVQENLEDALPQKTLILQAVDALLGKCLPCMPIDTIEERLLQYVLPSSNQLFQEAMEGIHVMLQDVPDHPDEELLESLNSLLQVCIEILKCMDYPLDHIQSLGKTDVSLVQSLPKVVSCVLLEAFKHCKESEKLYGTLFQTASEVLTKLFQRSRELQLKFLSLVTENLQFNCLFEEELVLLVETLEIFGKIGQLVSGLDIKTMAEQWKGYARLAFQYTDHLKPRLDVASPLQFLATDISNSLNKLVEMDPPDMKFVTRSVKVGSFTLKIIIKFCDQYSGYLGTCHQQLLCMLLTMYRFSRPYLQMKRVPQEVIHQVETHITIGAEPLLKHLVSEVEFAEKYFAYGNKLAEFQEDRLGFMLLSVSILKKLIHSKEDERKLWINIEPENNIIFIVFRALDHCHAEMNWDLKIAGISHSGEPERMTDLYEFVLTHMAGFILSTSAHKFVTVEQALVESLLQPSVWRAMLAMDIWCIVARSGSSDLCFQHLCVLLEILKCLVNHHGCPEKVYVTTLAHRLFSFLSNKHKNMIVEKYPPAGASFVWQALSVKVLPEKLRASVTDILLKSAISDTETIITSTATVQQYNDAVNSIAAATQCCKLYLPTQAAMISSLAGHVVTLWQRVSLRSLTHEESSVKGSQWFNHFLAALCAITAPLTLKMSNIQLIKVLVRLKEAVSRGPSSVRIMVLTVLRGLAKKFLDSTPDQMKVFQHIADLFSTLLQDKNHLVEVKAFEVFTYFAHVNSHETILALSVKNNVSLQFKTKQYLQKIPYKPHENKLLAYESYLLQQSQAKFSHNCKNVNLTVCKENSEIAELKLTSEIEIQPPKKLKLTESENAVNKSIERLKQEISIIQEYCEAKSLPHAAKEELLQVSAQLKRLC